MFFTFLSVLQVVASILLVVVVLLQPSKGGGLTPLGGGGSQSLLGNSGGTHLLFKVTAWLAIFIAISTMLIVRHNVSGGKDSVIDRTSALNTPTPLVPAKTAAAPTAPNAMPPPSQAASKTEAKVPPSHLPLKK